MTDEPREPVLLAHEADGIKEYDNKLPRWWLNLFYISIVFSVFYMAHYHILETGPGSAARYENEMLRAQNALGAGGGETTAAATEASTDPAVLARGADLFARECASCHGKQGEGLIGPNMTDPYFIHGSTFLDAVQVINDGVLAKGMIAWKTKLRPHEIESVASYIKIELDGKNVPGPRGPEGKKAEASTPEPVAAEQV